MKILLRLLLNLLIVLLAANFIAGQEKYQSLIKGRVIDENGLPVENAQISFDISTSLYKHFCWVKNNSVWSDKDGNFIHEEYCGMPNRTVFLYIVSTAHMDGAEVPIAPLFWSKLRQNNLKFAGLPVIVVENKEVNLGDVPVQVWYNKIDLFVFNKKGKPYYKTHDDWSNFYLIVRDEKGDDVGNSALSNYDVKNKIDLKKGFIKITLPEGTWTLELLADLDDYDNKSGITKRYLAKTTVTIKKSEPALPVSLIVKQAEK